MGPGGLGRGEGLNRIRQKAEVQEGAAFPKLDLIPIPEPGRSGDPLAIHEGAVEAPQILNEPPFFVDVDGGVPT